MLPKETVPTCWNASQAQATKSLSSFTGSKKSFEVMRLLPRLLEKDDPCRVLMVDAAVRVTHVLHNGKFLSRSLGVQPRLASCARRVHG
mmetsp:Transcript_4848/g.8020  ORF Transcript_4848/g.8020 Transcript_4848/m.8020 type:complete len:89 (+) Transcript_4848:1209-1475(+)